jgi:phosphoribosyl-ATP pyrophosphohydrolase/phosphoribosyl-AMP cyclohydrolase
MMNIIETVRFDASGLIPAIVQDTRTDEVLMLAYMNEESLRKTVQTGKAHYYSRSRKKLWLKGETSGNFQKVRSISIDCDGDALLLKVEQTGQACHTGHYSCFFTRFGIDEINEGTGIPAANGTGSFPACGAGSGSGDASGFSKTPGSGNGTGSDDEPSPVHGSGPAPVSTVGPGKATGPEVLGEVFDVITDRLAHPKEGSYTNYLFGKGLDKILKKIGEEACEVIIASKSGNTGEISSEIADLLYHVMVLLAERGMSLDDVYEELVRRK